MKSGLKAGVALAAMIAGVAAEGAPVQRAAPVSGRIVATKAGETAVLVPENRARRAEARQDLKAGDVLRTNAGGTLAIVFADQTQIRLGRNAVLVVKQVTRGSPSSLQLQRGSMWARSPRGRSNLSVETPSATAAIRGTEWSLTADDDSSSLSVFSGEVEFMNPQGSLSVTGGQAARALIGQAPTRVVLVNPSGREQMLYFVTLEDGLNLFGAVTPALSDAHQAALAGRWDEAEELYASIAARSDGRAKAIADHGRHIAAMQLGRAGTPPALDPAEPASYVGGAFLATYVGDLDGALGIIDEGLSRHPGEAGLYELKARVALLRGDGAMASAAVAEALARDPEDAAALALRAEIKADYLGQPYSALDDAEQAVRIDPTRGESFETLSAIRLERNADREAARALRQAIEREPRKAALRAHHAAALLLQNRVEAAKREIDLALEIDPSLSIARTVLAQYYVQTGQPDKALEEVLAASADNPSYSRALIKLAEVYYRQGDRAAAEQQLDAADRLDPNSPLVPLARAAIALHSYAAADAIRAAREALRRFQARGGVYSNLSENRTTGSYVSQSFRFLDLEGWGRYYGDRVFDAFTPSSYFDQALNQTASPFVTQADPFDVADSGRSFDSQNAEDLEQISSYLQGLTLDPLSISGSEVDLQFTNEKFIEAKIGGSGLIASDFARLTQNASVYGLTHAPLPLAFSVNVERADFDNRLIDFAALKEERVEIYAGAEITPYDRVVAFVGGESSFKDFRGFDPAEGIRATEKEDIRLNFGFYTHEFGARDELTIGGGFGSLDTINNFETDEPQARGRTEQLADIETLMASYARSFGRLDLEAGIETIEYDTINRETLFGDPDQVVEIPVTLTQRRIYVDGRFAPRGPFIVQAQLAGVRDGIGIPGFGGVHQNNWDYRFGIAYEPAKGHWLRAAATRRSSSAVPLTLAPTTSIGLKENIAPSQFGGQFDTYIARWDAEWSARLFTAAEYQHQNFENLSYDSPDQAAAIEVGRARVDRASFAVNYWAGGNIGINASYAYAESEQRDPPLRGLPIFYLPTHVARAGVAWTSEERIAARLSGVYVAGSTDALARDVPDYFIADAEIAWEPFGKRTAVKLVLSNIFDAEAANTVGIPGRPRTLFASLNLRF
ncbi:FecR domain-containing protein [Enterovirga sp. GCM10030262]|uniref:FecR domain-containing protein n=1 Tax=Enterovirga sp. GCM10030262 TaxID=3273391 RepID=UPI00361A69C7